MKLGLLSFCPEKHFSQKLAMIEVKWGLVSDSSFGVFAVMHINAKRKKYLQLSLSGVR